jgi:hypothetical protein
LFEILKKQTKQWSVGELEGIEEEYKELYKDALENN